MKLVVIMLTALAFVAASAPSRRKCACWTGFKRQSHMGKVQCSGEYISHVMPCNVPQPPKCTCHGHDGILKDRSGTWCTIYRSGVEIRRWTCENTKQWNEFLIKYKKYVRKQYEAQRLP